MKFNIYKAVSNLRINKHVPQMYQGLLPKAFPEGEYTLIVFSASKDEAIISKHVEKALRKIVDKSNSYILIFAEKLTIGAIYYLNSIGIKHIALSEPDSRTDQQYNDMKNHLDPHIK
ncbi:hypothetical protein P4H66_08360 [Paenibacillus dokdonensis]|uniref:Uncharacterized protein n=1 Tax=Paenibacillus dokdonensis TaxID=2567944 RepID=A0ABU6GJF2_9BACL|nr:hypothetical protein [Paenibacillus dokdonensis]MEC0239865.1 hypothetical protein [Paenibacillus dokdonensis]